MNHPQEILQILGGGYDIREIDEELYLAVLARRKAQSDCSTADIDGCGKAMQLTAGDTKRP